MDYKKLALEFLGDFVPRKLPIGNVTNLSRGELGAIMTLNFDKDHVLVGDIAEHLRLTSGRTASILKSLERKEMITKTKSEEDARQTYISLTDKGRALAKEHSEEVLENFTSLLEFLGKKDALEFVRINKRIVDYTEREKKHGKR